MGRRPDGVLIDFDGTIAVNTFDIAMRFTTDYLNRLTPVSEETVRNMFMVMNKFPPGQFIQHLFRHLGFAEHTADFLVRFSALHEYRGMTVQIREGFGEFLSWCREEGITYRIFSSQLKSKIVHSLGETVAAEQIVEMGEGSKSSTSDFATILRKLPPLQRWCLIDDDPFILRTAKLVGLSTALMHNALFSEREVDSYRDFIDRRVHNFGELRRSWTRHVRGTGHLSALRAQRSIPK